MTNPHNPLVATVYPPPPKNKFGFTLAEALVFLLISSLILVATMPVITKKKRQRIIQTHGTPGGWVCLRASMPCTFTPPVKALHFAVYFDDSKIPDYSAYRLQKMVIVRSSVPNSLQGCGSAPDLNRYLDDYTKGKALYGGTFCTGAKLVRIVY